MSQIDEYMRPPRVCLCKGVTRAEIEEAIKNGAVTVDDVARVTMASTGCGSCKNKIQEIIKSNTQ